MWSIQKYDCFGATSFFINKSIDDGQIINRSIYEYPKLKLHNFQNIHTKELYRFWFSFMDPIIRSRHFDDFILGKVSLQKNIFESNKKFIDKNEYFTFMDELNIKRNIKKALDFD